MKIEGKLRGDVTIKRVALYESTGTRMATVHVSARLDRDGARRLLGDDFAKLVLPEGAGQRDEDGTYHHAFSSLKPAGRFESHKVKLFKRSVTVVPEMSGVSTVDKEEAVDLELDLPLEVAKDDAGWWGELAVRVGETFDVEFQPRQMELPGTSDTGPKVVKMPGPHGAKVPQVVG